MKTKDAPEVQFTIHLPGNFGKLLVSYCDGRLMSVRIAGRNERRRRENKVSRPAATRDESLEQKLRADFRAYFSGKKVSFDYPLDDGKFTPFQRAVWGAMRKIRYGETRPYRWLAQEIGKPTASRAVGNACGKNPFLIIQPCHRVVGSGGTLGGFSAGLDLKKALLKLEGVDVAQMRPNKKGFLKVNIKERRPGALQLRAGQPVHCYGSGRSHPKSGTAESAESAERGT